MQLTYSQFKSELAIIDEFLQLGLITLKEHYNKERVIRAMYNSKFL